MSCGSLVRKHCCEVFWEAVSSERMWTYMSACHGVALSWLTWFCMGQLLGEGGGTRKRVNRSSAMTVNFIVKQHECGVCFSNVHLLQLNVYKISVATQCISQVLSHRTLKCLHLWQLYFVSCWWCNDTCLFCKEGSKDHLRQSQIQCQIILFFIKHVFLCVLLLSAVGCVVWKLLTFFKIVLEQVHQEQFVLFYDSFSFKDRF